MTIQNGSQFSDACEQMENAAKAAEAARESGDTALEQAANRQFSEADAAIKEYKAKP
ncbi:hypothetical protein [Streptomyces sp. NPDC059278]|uniref:hypothetical protein n=1 Tax=Streptomyces sp. NPDC059278 TaxID=3346801 RepID=UPI003679B110